MPQRNEVARALRYFKQSPNISQKGIRYFANKLRESEEEPDETQKYLQLAYRYLQEKRQYKPGHPMLRNINRLSRAMKS